MHCYKFNFTAYHALTTDSCDFQRPLIHEFMCNTHPPVQHTLLNSLNWSFYDAELSLLCLHHLWFHSLWCTWNWVRALERDSTLLHHFLQFYRGHKCKGVLSHLCIPYHSAASSFLFWRTETQRVLKKQLHTEHNPRQPGPQTSLTPNRHRNTTGSCLMPSNQDCVCRSCQLGKLGNELSVGAGTKHSLLELQLRLCVSVCLFQVLHSESG